jgi:hypothetical protein
MTKAIVKLLLDCETLLKQADSEIVLLGKQLSAEVQGSTNLIPYMHKAVILSGLSGALTVAKASVSVVTLMAQQADK